MGALITIEELVKWAVVEYELRDKTDNQVNDFMLVVYVMSQILITKTGKVIECIGGRHDLTCLVQLKCTLKQFIQRGGVRVKHHHDSLAVESKHHLTSEQTNKVNKVLRQDNIYSIHTCIKGIEHWRNSFRPIRGLCAEIR